MILSKKWSGMLAVITVALLLGACGDKKGSEQSVDESNYDNPRNYEAEDFMVLSDGFDDYAVWIETDTSLARTNTVNNVYVFKNGVVENYRNFGGMQIEELNDLTDEEFIQHVVEKAKLKQEGSYTLDITRDGSGNYTEKMDVVVTNGVSISELDLETSWWESGLETKEDYIQSIEGNDRYRVEEESVFVTDAMEDGDSILTLYPVVSQQKIFDTTYSGLKLDDYYSLFTRVDDGFAGFVLDAPNTDKENVTIEGE